MNISLKNKNAIVCGSTQGIGKAIAKGLAEKGASVTLVARNEQALEEVKKELNTAGGQQHEYIVADFNDPEGLRKKIDGFCQKKEVHILINNTGGPPPGPVSEAKTEDFLTAFNQHLICNHILALGVLPGMKNAGYGRIINIISTSIKQPIPNLGVSNTIRGAVASWAKTLSGEVAKYGVTVNNVLPGATNTQRLQNIIERKANKSNIGKEVASEEMQAEIPAGRFAEPEEVANAAVFLASPAAGYINGVSIAVDGGRTNCL